MVYRGGEEQTNKKTPSGGEHSIALNSQKMFVLRAEYDYNTKLIKFFKSNP